jgi:hypothetical protein
MKELLGDQIRQRDGIAGQAELLFAARAENPLGRVGQFKNVTLRGI